MNLFESCPYCDRTLNKNNPNQDCSCCIAFYQYSGDTDYLRWYSFNIPEMDLAICQDFDTLAKFKYTTIYHLTVNGRGEKTAIGKRIAVVPHQLPLPTKENLPTITNTLRLWLTFA